MGCKGKMSSWESGFVLNAVPLSSTFYACRKYENMYLRTMFLKLMPVAMYTLVVWPPFPILIRLQGDSYSVQVMLTDESEADCGRDVIFDVFWMSSGLLAFWVSIVFQN